MNTTPTLQHQKTLKHDRQFLRCRFDADAAHLYAAGYDGRLSRWNLADGTAQTIDAHRGWVEGMAVSPDRRELYTADSWGQVRAWRLDPQADFAKLTPRWTIERACGSWLRDLAVSPDGRWLATCGNEPVVRVFSAADGKLLHELRGHESPVYSVTFVDDEHLASGDLLGGVRHWQRADGKLVRTLDAGKLFKPFHQYRQGGVRTMAFAGAESGGTLYCGGFEGTNANQAQGVPTVVAFDWKTGQAQLVMTAADAFNGPVMDLAVHPRGFVIGAGSSEGGGALWFWRPGEAKSVATVKNSTSFRRFDFTADGTRLAAAAFGDQDGQRGGNGRRLNAKGEYPDFGGHIALYEWK